MVPKVELAGRALVVTLVEQMEHGRALQGPRADVVNEVHKRVELVLSERHGDGAIDLVLAMPNVLHQPRVRLVLRPDQSLMYVRSSRSPSYRPRISDQRLIRRKDATLIGLDELDTVERRSHNGQLSGMMKRTPPPAVAGPPLELPPEPAPNAPAAMFAAAPDPLPAVPWPKRDDAPPPGFFPTPVPPAPPGNVALPPP